MRSSLFIKTCIADYGWLEWCLKSIDKYGTFDEYVIAIGISDFNTIPAEFLREPYKWVKVEDDLDYGYLNQQLIKHHADLYCEGDYILFMDSDCVFTDAVNIDTYLVDGRPIVPFTPYKVLGDAVPWKAITERCVGFVCYNEFMRRHPLVFRRQSLAAFRKWFEEEKGQIIAQYIKAQPNKEYSEFNVLGSWVDRYDSGHYKFLNTEEHDNIPCHVKQYWSYAGISGEIGEELRAICN